jgi:hypothetical protein
MWASPLHVLIIGIVILVLFGGIKIKPRKPPTHPLPATSPLEKSRASVAPKEKPCDKDLSWKSANRTIGLGPEQTSGNPDYQDFP